MSIRANYIATKIAHQLMLTYPESKAYIIVKQPTYCFDDPTDMRIVDVALVWAHRLADRLDDNELHIVPDLVVEVVVPERKFNDVDDRIEDYLKAGASMIWVVSPGLRNVYVYRSDGSVAKFRESDTIRDEPLLPGLAVNVASFLPDLKAGT
jgi:Uma2 family endonuclease